MLRAGCKAEAAAKPDAGLALFARGKGLFEQGQYVGTAAHACAAAQKIIHAHFNHRSLSRNLLQRREFAALVPLRRHAAGRGSAAQSTRVARPGPKQTAAPSGGEAKAMDVYAKTGVGCSTFETISAVIAHSQIVVRGRSRTALRLPAGFEPTDIAILDWIAAQTWRSARRLLPM